MECGLTGRPIDHVGGRKKHKIHNWCIVATMSDPSFHLYSTLITTDFLCFLLSHICLLMGATYQCCSENLIVRKLQHFNEIFSQLSSDIGVGSYSYDLNTGQVFDMSCGFNPLVFSRLILVVLLDYCQPCTSDITTFSVIPGNNCHSM